MEVWELAREDGWGRARHNAQPICRCDTKAFAAS
jgi:hypothetical protein